MEQVTRILNELASGQRAASDELLPLVYEELRRLAQARMAQERSDHTLQATALVHEAYMRLAGPDNAVAWEGRRHFFGAAAEAMRRILIESARRKQRIRHGGQEHFVPADAVDAEVPAPEGLEKIDILALDEALAGLQSEDERKAELVKLRCFAGLSLEQSADVLGISRATASRWWEYARAWLFDAMKDDSN
jgi:RNA polymerase sigma factor (TIGR02999 family)